MLNIVLIVLGGLVLGGLLSLGYALLVVSGRGIDEERREYLRRTGQWPEW